MNKELAESLIGVGSSFLTDIFGSIGQRNTNRTNLQIARETNAQNMKLMQTQQRWNELMYQRQYDDNLALWNMQNDYNDASSQRQRLEAAGLNPYMMMNGGSAGTAQGIDAPSPQNLSVPTMQGATMQNPVQLDNFNMAMQNLSDRLYNRRLQEANIRSINASAEGSELSNKWIEPTAQALYNKTKQETKGFEINNWIQENAKHYILEDYRNRAWESFENQRLRNAQVYNTLLDNRAKEILNAYSEPQLISNLLLGIADLNLKDANYNYVNHQIKNLILQNSRLSMDNKLFGELFDYILDAQKTKYNYESSYYNNELNWLATNFGTNKKPISYNQFRRTNSLIEQNTKYKDLLRPITRKSTLDALGVPLLGGDNDFYYNSGTHSFDKYSPLGDYLGDYRKGR
nr:MAG TPA: hypothetical protein [Microviridae sp.]